MKAPSIFLALILGFTSSSLPAQHPSLQTASSKVDMNGTFVSINRVDGDIHFLSSYAAELIKLAQSQGKSIPADLDIAKLLSITALDRVSAIARSNTAINKSTWLNQAYLQNDGCKDGIFSIVNGKTQPFITPQIAPSGTDIAIQLELDLRQSPELARALAIPFGASKSVDESLSSMFGPFKVTVEEALQSSNIRVLIAIDFDEKNRFDLGKINIGRPRILIRIDGVHWLWKKSAEKLMNDLFIPFDRTEKEGIITYSSPPEMVEAFQGFEPAMEVDAANDQIWISTSRKFIKQARNEKNSLANDPAFLTTWEGLPTSGNSMAYISKSFLTELNTIYKTAIEKKWVDAELFKNQKPLVDKLIGDILKSDTGLALSLQQDATGIHLASKLPFPDKYLNLIPIIKSMMNGQAHP